MTPHIEASPGDYAETVLVAGDPLRVEWIANTFLDEPRCVNRLRGALGYTGNFHGVRISLQTTGMGRPSFSIYVHELVAFYGARTVMRIGSCGALTDQTPLRDVFVAESAVMDTDLVNGVSADRPDETLLRYARQTAKIPRMRVISGRWFRAMSFIIRSQQHGSTCRVQTASSRWIWKRQICSRFRGFWGFGRFRSVPS